MTAIFWSLLSNPGHEVLHSSGRLTPLVTRLNLSFTASWAQELMGSEMPVFGWFTGNSLHYIAYTETTAVTPMLKILMFTCFLQML